MEVTGVEVIRVADHITIMDRVEVIKMKDHIYCWNRPLQLLD